MGSEDVYITGNRHDQVREVSRPLDREPRRGVGARGDGRCGRHDQRHPGALQRQPDDGVRDGRPADPAGDRPDGHPRRSTARTPARPARRRSARATSRSRPASTTRSSRSASRSSPVLACSAAAAARSKGIHPEGLHGLGLDALRVRRGRHGPREGLRHDLRAVRADRREEPPPLDHEPEGAVPDRDARSKRS